MTTSPDPRRWWVLGALMLAVVLVGLDSTILNVALPTLAADLGASTAQLQWTVDAFVLVLAGLLLPAGAVADRLGRRPVLVTGIAIFTLGSLGAAYSGTATWLIVTRAVMGIGAAVIMTVPLAVLPSIFEADERPKAIASVTVALGLGLPLGPILGGWLLQHVWWGSVFLINVPLGVVAALGVAVLLPASRETSPSALDLPGAALSTAGLVGLVYAVVEAPVRGWTSAPVVLTGLAGIALLAGFVAWERRTATPMVDLALLSRPRFTWGTVSATVAMFAMLGLLFVVPLYLQSVRGFDPLGTGLRLLPLILGLVVGAKAGERLTVGLGARVPVAAGLLVIAAALVWAGATLEVGTPYALMAGWLGLTGAGLGLTITPAMDAVLDEVPEEHSGSGTALTMALRQVGGALGVAVLGSLASAAYTGRLDLTGLPAPAAEAAQESVTAGMAVAQGNPALAASVSAAYVHAMTVVLLVTAAVAVAGALVAALRLPARGSSPSADRESVTIAA
ncbi:DHA2 family efflux MFS transporter permease subunit [Geodermatophilus sp. URMC 64]